MPDKNYRILIVDDDPGFHSQIRYAFRRNFVFEGAVGMPQLDKKLQSGEEFDLILLDLVLDDSKHKIGLELINQIKNQRPDWPIIVVTNDKEYETVVEAMKRGADDFLQKGSYDYDKWEAKFRNAIEKYTLKEENRSLRREIAAIKALHEYHNPPDHPLLGDSPQMEQIRKTLKMVADEPDLTVLITGETGVGKSIAARFLHYNSQSRRLGPFEEILISNIPETLLESTLFGAKKGTFTDAKSDIQGRLHMADKGIVFLDEIGDLYPDIQGKLIQFLQTKTIRPIGSKSDIVLDVQIVAATNKNLREEVHKGNFREDLYQRLKVFPVEIPPLRERREDIRTLMLHFMKLDDERRLDETLDDPTRQLLVEDYNWVGNVRELQNTVRYMQLQQKAQGTKKITPSCLPEEIRNHRQVFHQYSGYSQIASNPELVFSPMPTGLSWDEQNDYNTLLAIEKALIEKNGKKKDVAKKLNIKSADSLRYRIKVINEKYPHLLEGFPTIRSNYGKLID